MLWRRTTAVYLAATYIQGLPPKAFAEFEMLGGVLPKIRVKSSGFRSSDSISWRVPWVWTRNVKIAGRDRTWGCRDLDVLKMWWSYIDSKFTHNIPCPPPSIGHLPSRILGCRACWNEERQTGEAAVVHIRFLWRFWIFWTSIDPALSKLYNKWWIHSLSVFVFLSLLPV